MHFWKLLDGGGKEKACDSQMFVFLFLPLGRVCLSSSLNHSHRSQSAIVPRHSASCAASVGRSDFDILSTDSEPPLESLSIFNSDQNPDHLPHIGDYTQFYRDCKP